ncbi:MAG: ABC transporter permease [Gammaproteobacteria bacterium]|nr:ABC transporter permease [Gammaproteobacteria bacterium]
MFSTFRDNRTFDLKAFNKIGEYLSKSRLPKVAESFAQSVLIPFAAILAFLLIWSMAARQVQTSLGELPGPIGVWKQTVNLYDEHRAERSRELKFYERMQTRIDKAVEEREPLERIEKLKERKYTGTSTFIDQIFTSLRTVMTGFILASVIAIPIGIVIGMSHTLYRAFNPIIQVFRPVSPLAWLPLVTIVVSAVYVSKEPWFEKSFLTSAITVTLCCLWPTIVNTAVGVSGVSKDLINVSRVLQLNWFTKTMKIVLPSSIPMMFTGLRLSLSIGWMVLIAAEMLAQNPGLGKFVWDEFQNGSSNSMARIMVAVIVIGIIGFMLDRAMLFLQRAVSWDKNAVLR